MAIPKFGPFKNATGVLTARERKSVNDTIAAANTLTAANIVDKAAIDLNTVARSAQAARETPTVETITTIATLTAEEIVGNSAGDVGHVDGAILVAAPGTGYALEFVSAFMIYDYDVAAYTGGADDTIIQVGVNGAQVTVSGAITGANLLEASGDKMLRLGCIATELVFADNGVISLYGTALTQPGAAAGVLRVHVTYRKHTTGL